MVTYSTSDIHVASTLIAIGYTNYFVKKEGKVAFFVFESDGDDEAWQAGIKANVDMYYSENYDVAPKKLFNAFRELKNRIFNNTQREAQHEQQLLFLP